MILKKTTAIVLIFSIILTMTPIFAPNIYATRAAKTHTVTINANENGTLNLNGSLVSGNTATFEVADGANLDTAMKEQGYTLNPNEGYKLKELEMQTNAKVIDVQTGAVQTAVLLDNGTVWAIGSNTSGQLGDGTVVDKNYFVQMKTVVDGNTVNMTGVTAISTLNRHIIALKEDGTVWGVGANGNGQLSIGSKVNQKTFVQMKQVIDGKSVNMTGVIAISTDRFSTVVLKNDGTVWLSGYCNYLVEDSELFETTTFMQFDITDVAAVGLGQNHITALKRDGTVWSIGNNSSGLFGDGTNTSKTSFVKGDISDVVAISVGQFYTVALKKDGTVWSTGMNKYGQLGDGTTVSKNTFEKSDISDVVAISTGEEHTVALKNDGTVWAVGNNSYGQLGDGTSGKDSYKSNFVQMKQVVDGKHVNMSGVIDIDASGINTIVLKNDNTVWAVGDNSCGQLGDGTKTTKSTFVSSNIDGVNPISKYSSFASIKVTENITVTPRIFYMNPITLSVDKDTLNYGEEITITAKLTNVSKLKGVNIGFYHNNSNLGYAHTDENGVATLTIKPSVGSIKYWSKFYYPEFEGEFISNYAEFTVNVAPQDKLILNGIPSTNINYGDDNFTVNTTGGSGTGAITYTSSNTDVAMVNENTGEVTIVGVGTFTITATKAADANYKEVTETSSIIKVNPKPVSILGVTVNDKTYDSTTDAIINTSGEISKVLSGDYVTIIQGTCSFNKSNAGSSVGVTATGFQLSGADAEKYVLIEQPIIPNAQISKKDVVVGGIVSANKTYDGTTTATLDFTNATFVGILSGDSLNVTATGKFDDANVGIDKGILITNIILGGQSASNYKIATIGNQTSTTANITEKSLSIDKVEIQGINDSYIYTGLPNILELIIKDGATTLVKDKDYTVSYSNNINIGTATVTITFIGNYSGSAIKNFEILFGVAADGSFTIPTTNETGWYKEDIVVLAGKDYTISSTADGAYTNSITIADESVVEGSDYTFYLKDANGKIYKKTISYKLDKTQPTNLEVKYNTNGWKALLNKISFGVFFKENVDVTVRAEDSLSGIKDYQYFASDVEITDFKNVVWQDNLSIIKNSKKLIYVKATDNAGNFVIAYEGVVVYTDSELTLNNAEFNVDEKSDINVILTLNGNTIKNIKNGDTVLTMDIDYVIDGNNVTIKKEYLETALIGESLILTFTFNPLEESFSGTENAPQTAIITINKHVHTAQADDGNCATPINCRFCNHEMTAAKTHDFSGAWQHDEITHWHSCCNNNCVQNDTKVEHTYNIKGNEILPSYFTNGTRIDSCECNSTITVVLPKLIDNEAPTGTISIDKNNWNSFLNKVTFGIFFKDTQTITVKADDNNKSGINKIYYHLANNIISDFANVSWKEFNGILNINPNNKFVVYVKITDKVGNETIINSNGIVLDNIVPQISGVENGKTYCTEMKVSVLDDNLDNVTVNGIAATLTNNIFTLSPDNGEQIVVAYDKSGNSTTIKASINGEHKWNDGTISTEPTADKEGTKTYKCIHCDSTKYESISKKEPTIIEGANIQWNPNKNETISFRSNASIKDFVNVMVDNNIVSSTDYILKEGSTIVELKVEYLATLSAGDHTLAINSTTGTASTKFTITSNSEYQTMSETVDNFYIWVWIIVFILACGTVITLGSYLKIKKLNKN